MSLYPGHIPEVAQIVPGEVWLACGISTRWCVDDECWSLLALWGTSQEPHLPLPNLELCNDEPNWAR